MAQKNIHVIKNNDVWQVKREGSQRASKVVIHGRDGKIRDKDSYGNDPIPPRDRKY